MSIVSFFPRKQAPAAPQSNDWSQQEIAEFYRALHLLRQNGVTVGLDRGLTDRGDPWFVLFDDASQDVFVHIARIGSVCVLVAEAVGLRLEASSIEELVPRFETAVRSLVQDRSTQGSNVVLHPTARVLLSIAILFVLAKLQSTTAEASAEGGLEQAATNDLVVTGAGIVDFSQNELDDGLRKSGLQTRLQAFVQRAAEMAESPLAIAAAAQLMLTAVLWELEPERYLLSETTRDTATPSLDIGSQPGTYSLTRETVDVTSTIVADAASTQSQLGDSAPPVPQSELSSPQHEAARASPNLTQHLDSDGFRLLDADSARPDSRSQISEGIVHWPEPTRWQLSELRNDRGERSEITGNLINPTSLSGHYEEGAKSEIRESYMLLSSVIGPADNVRLLPIDGTPGSPLIAVMPDSASDLHRAYLIVDRDPSDQTQDKPADLTQETPTEFTPVALNSPLTDRFNANDDLISLSALEGISTQAGYVRMTHAEGNDIAFALRHVIIAFKQSEIEISNGDVLIEQAKADKLAASDLGVWVNTMADGSRLVIVGTAQLVESFEHYVIG